MSTADGAARKDEDKAAQMDAFYKMAKYPLLRNSDMLSEVQGSHVTG